MWIAEVVGTSPAYVSRIVNGKENIVNKASLSMMETLGYDVRLVYDMSREAPTLDV